MVDLSIIAMGDHYVVRYMKYQDHYPAKDFLDACTTEERARFFRLATVIATQGRLPDATHGHQLKGDYADLFEFKPLGKRVFGFFHFSRPTRNLYVTSGAPKRNPKAQTSDYDTALNLRADFLARLASPKAKKAR